MKQLNLIRQLTLFALFMLCSSVLLAQTGPAVGQVSELEGQASVIRAATTSIAVGGDIFQSDILVTAAASFLQVSLTDGSTLSLDEDSRLEISEYVTSPNPSSLMSLARGRLRTQVSTAFSSRRESFKVQTREGTMGVQGTEFDVLAEPRQTVVYVYDGFVSAASRDPRYPEATVLGPGDWIRIRLGEPTPPPDRFIIAGTSPTQPGSGTPRCLIAESCSQVDDPPVTAPEPPSGLGPPVPPELNPPGS
jgi:hypothetical protein